MFCFLVYNESIQSLNFNNLKDSNESCQRQIRQFNANYIRPFPTHGVFARGA